MSQQEPVREYVDIPPTDVEAPDAHGKFSLSEDWTATIVGLCLLGLCLLQVIPNLKGLF